MSVRVVTPPQVEPGSGPDVRAADRRALVRAMDHTYRITEIVGSSPDSIDEAIRNGLGRAAQTLRHLDWFEVSQIRGVMADGQVAHYQVGLKVGFRLEEC